jgi:hypothetical protein
VAWLGGSAIGPSRVLAVAVLAMLAAVLRSRAWLRARQPDGGREMS